MFLVFKWIWLLGEWAMGGHLKVVSFRKRKAKGRSEIIFCIKKFLFERVASLNKSIKSIELLPLLNCIWSTFFSLLLENPIWNMIGKQNITPLFESFSMYWKYVLKTWSYVSMFKLLLLKFWKYITGVLQDA